MTFEKYTFALPCLARVLDFCHGPKNWGGVAAVFDFLAAMNGAETTVVNRAMPISIPLISFLPRDAL